MLRAWRPISAQSLHAPAHGFFRRHDSKCWRCMHTCVEVWSTSLRTSLQFGFLHFLSCNQTAGWRQHAAIAMAAQQVELRVENALYRKKSQSPAVRTDGTGRQCRVESARQACRRRAVGRSRIPGR